MLVAQSVEHTESRLQISDYFPLLSRRSLRWLKKLLSIGMKI
jgi:hypothetical protein